MRAVVQRVKCASVRVGDETVGAIDEGLLVYLAAGSGDVERDVDYMAEKIAGLRVFEDEARSMNRSVVEVAGQALVVSQFTLYGDCRRGKRPSFTDAMRPAEAQLLVDALVAALERRGVPTRKGRFGAMMEVESVGWGPVTILLDSQKVF